MKDGARRPQPYCKPCFLAYWKEWYETKGGRAAFKAANARYRGKYPERHRARSAAYAALEDGRIQRGPCAVRDGRCNGRPQMHHPDYSQPLHVVWLCPLHHREADTAAGIGRRGRPRRAVVA